MEFQSTAIDKTNIVCCDIESLWVNEKEYV